MKKRRTLLAGIALLFLLQSAPAGAIETVELRESLDAYRTERVALLEAEREAELAELRLLNGPYDNVTTEFPWKVERWRPVVDMYFPDDRIDWALRIIACESRGEPDAKNPTSSASGLFQHLARLWPERAEAAGFGDYDVFDPYANIAVAAWLLETGGPGHWVCKAGK